MLTDEANKMHFAGLTLDLIARHLLNRDGVVITLIAG
jgi:hypothetical protein